jgi:hypothetical protein
MQFYRLVERAGGFARALLAVAASLLIGSGALAQDGARAYFLLPQETDIASLTATFLEAELGGNEFGVGVVTPSYRRAIDLGGTASTILIGIPFGGLSASIDNGSGIVDLDSETAQGDLFIGAEWGFLGSPSLSPMEFAQFKPGLRASAAAKLFLPTGDYDSSEFLNLGANRWSLQASLPISYVLADTMIDPNLTTFEFVPNVQIFGDNDEPFGGGSVMTQDPLWTIEGHVTRNFGPTLWAAIDGYYKFGGQISVDGAPKGESEETVSLGATLGLVLSPSLAFRLSYVQQVHSNLPDTSARGLEFSTALSF